MSEDANVHRRRMLSIVAAYAVVLAGSARATQPVELTVFPTICVEPCHVRILVRTQPQEDDRRLTIELSSDEFFRSSTLQLEGTEEAAVHTVEWRAIPAGRYEVRALVGRRGKQVASPVATVVVSRGLSPVAR